MIPKLPQLDIAASEIALIREQLTQIGFELTLYLASLWQLSPYTVKADRALQNKNVEHLADKAIDREKMLYVITIYKGISAFLEDERLQSKYADCNKFDHAVQRILTGEDFPSLDDELGISDLHFWMLKRVLHVDDVKTMSLIGRRAALVEQIAHIKKRHRLPIRHPDREEVVIASARELAVQYDLPATVIDVVYTSILFPLAFELEEAVFALPE